RDAVFARRDADRRYEQRNTFAAVDHAHFSAHRRTEAAKRGDETGRRRNLRDADDRRRCRPAGRAGCEHRCRSERPHNPRKDLERFAEWNHRVAMIGDVPPHCQTRETKTPPRGRGWVERNDDFRERTDWRNVPAAAVRPRWSPPVERIGLAATPRCSRRGPRANRTPFARAAE